jgi:hypothetical protein
VIEKALFGLLHVLVFVYWLGGDLGAFYSSRFLTKPGVSAEKRLLAAKIIGDVDMAPRTALILTLPTGLALAQASGWVGLGWPVVWLAFLAAAVWLAVAWMLHLRHAGPGSWLRRADLFFRWALIAGALVWSSAALLGGVALPAFLALKLLILAACILLGLMIRIVLGPLGPALAALPGGAPEAESTVAATLAKARPLVLGIWFLLLCAAFLGLWTPATIGVRS